MSNSRPSSTRSCIPSGSPPRWRRPIACSRPNREPTAPIGAGLSVLHRRITGSKSLTYLLQKNSMKAILDDISPELPVEPTIGRCWGPNGYVSEHFRVLHANHDRTYPRGKGRNTLRGPRMTVTTPPTAKTAIRTFQQWIPTPKCALCPRYEGLERHHKTFRSQGGGDEAENLALLCRVCHGAVHGLRVIVDDFSCATCPVLANAGCYFGERLLGRSQDTPHPWEIS